MPGWIVYTIGFAAQLLFSARLILQWLLAEKRKTLLTPRLFWQFSLLASFLLFIYGYLRNDFAIMLGQAVTYFIYIRNLQLQGEWEKLPRAFRAFLWLFPALIVAYYYNNKVFDMRRLFAESGIPLWLMVLGAVSQLLFTLRFVYQWLYSERRRESVLPLGFWVLSFAGAALILTYAVFRRDPVLFLGHLVGCVVYFRNIRIIQNANENLG